MSLHRKVVALIAPLLLLGAFALLGAPGAQASSTVHKAKLSGSMDEGFVHPNQPKAKTTVTCNAATGSLSITAKNISGVAVSEISDPPVYVPGQLVALGAGHGPPTLSIQTNTYESGFVVHLTQGSNLLFSGSFTVTLPNKSDCRTGGFIAVGDFAGVLAQAGHFS